MNIAITETSVEFFLAGGSLLLGELNAVAFLGRCYRV